MNMNYKFLFLFMILLLGLVLSSFLGGKWIKEGFAAAPTTVVLPDGTTAPAAYTGPNGETVLITNSSGICTATITADDGSIINIQQSTNTDGGRKIPPGVTEFASDNTSIRGNLMKITQDNIGNMSKFPPPYNNMNLQVGDYLFSTRDESRKGVMDIMYTANTPTTSTTAATTTSAAMPNTYYGPSGQVAKLVNTSNGYNISVTDGNGNVTVYAINPSGASLQPANNVGVSQQSNPSALVNTIFYGPDGGTARVFKADDNDIAIEVTHPNGQIVIYTNTDTYSFNPFSSSGNSSSGMELHLGLIRIRLG